MAYHDRFNVAVCKGDVYTDMVQVIEPIQSRCAILRFTRLSDAEILSRLLYVCDQEKVQSWPWHTLYEYQYLLDCL